MKPHRRDKGRLAGSPKCPACGTKIDGFTGLTNEKAVPKDGDVSICWYCATPLAVRGERFVLLIGDDLDKAMTIPHFKAALAHVIARRKKRQS